MVTWICGHLSAITAQVGPPSDVCQYVPNDGQHINYLPTYPAPTVKIDGSGASSRVKVIVILTATNLLNLDWGHGLGSKIGMSIWERGLGEGCGSGLTTNEGKLVYTRITCTASACRTVLARVALSRLVYSAPDRLRILSLMF
jgi:hypothetical protein